MNAAGLRATLEGLEAQIEAFGAAVEAALSMLPDAEDEPPPATITPGRSAACSHERTEQAGGFGGNPFTHICVACGATVVRR